MSVPPAPPILLASTSPQRRAILEQLGIPFELAEPDYEEHDPPDADPVALVRDHAAGKARSVGEPDERPVLGVDTAVHLEGRLYGKPAGPEEAEEMLEALFLRHLLGWEPLAGEAEEVAAASLPRPRGRHPD